MGNDDDDFTIIEDTGSYGKKQGTTYQEILMNQISRITKIASQELKEGFWKSLPLKSGTGAMMMTKVWISDGRKEYINSIQCLNDLILPQFDEEIKKKVKELDATLKRKRSEYAKDKKPESSFIDAEVKIHRVLFQQLNLLIGRMGYFEEGSFTA